MPADLDDLERAAKAAMQRDERGPRIVTMLAGDAMEIAAELRAAREAVEFTRKAAGYFHGSTHGDAAAAIVAAYDKATGGGA